MGAIGVFPEEQEAYDLEQELKKGPAIVSVMLVNNEIGTIQDLKMNWKECKT